MAGRVSLSPAQVQPLKEHIHQELKRRTSEFCEHLCLTLYVGTLNMAGLEPTEQLHSWLVEPVVKAETSSPDIYVIGLQELVPLSASNLVGDSLSRTRADKWVENIKATLNDGCLNDSDCYQLVSCNHLVGICLVVFASQRHVPHVCNVDGQTTGAGPLGMGNKGACTTRLQLYDSSVCFVCSHLSAHRQHVEARNKDFANILARTHFHARVTTERESNFLGSAILDHDLVVWLGDLNYHFEQSLARDIIQSCIDAGSDRLDQLWEHDQLNIERAAGRVFEGFDEGPLMFSPTFKFVPGTDDYDNQRVPAWTDRILWHQRDLAADQPERLKQLLYQSCSDLKVSDHRPVIAIFDMRVDALDAGRKQQVCQDIVSALDMCEHQSLPTVLPSGIVMDHEKHQGVRHNDTHGRSEAEEIPSSGNIISEESSLRRQSAYSEKLGNPLPTTSLEARVCALEDEVVRLSARLKELEENQQQSAGQNAEDSFEENYKCLNMIKLTQEDHQRLLSALDSDCKRMLDAIARLEADSEAMLQQQRSQLAETKNQTDLHDGSSPIDLSPCTVSAKAAALDISNVFDQLHQLDLAQRQLLCDTEQQSKDMLQTIAVLKEEHHSLEQTLERKHDEHQQLLQQRELDCERLVDAIAHLKEDANGRHEQSAGLEFRKDAAQSHVSPRFEVSAPFGVTPIVDARETSPMRDHMHQLDDAHQQLFEQRGNDCHELLVTLSRLDASHMRWDEKNAKPNGHEVCADARNEVPSFNQRCIATPVLQPQQDRICKDASMEHSWNDLQRLLKQWEHDRMRLLSTVAALEQTQHCSTQKQKQQERLLHDHSVTFVATAKLASKMADKFDKLEATCEEQRALLFEMRRAVPHAPAMQTPATGSSLSSPCKNDAFFIFASPLHRDG